MMSQGIEDQMRNNGRGKKNRKLILAGVFIFFLAVVLGAMTVMEKVDVFASLGKSSKTPEKVETLKFDGIEVNLADRDRTHYLRTSIVLEYEDKKMGEEMAGKSYRLKDAIIEELRERSVQDLETGEGITSLKKEILTAVNRELTSGKATSIYFEEFIIQ